MNPHHVHTDRDRCRASLRVSLHPSLRVSLHRSCRDIAEARCLLPVLKAARAGAKRGHRQVAQPGPGGVEAAYKDPKRVISRPPKSCK